MFELTAVHLFEVSWHWNQEILDEIETMEELHDSIPPLCLPKYVVKDFTKLHRYKAEDHGQLIVIPPGQNPDSFGPTQIIELLEDEDLVLRPEQHDSLKGFGFVQSCSYMASFGQTVAETGDFWALFRPDLPYGDWETMGEFLNSYIPKVQAAIRNRYRINSDQPQAQSQITRIESGLKFTRRNQWKAAVGGQVFDDDMLEQFETFIDTIDELAWYVADMAQTEGKLPEYLL